jgi:hypothetical protein
VALAFYLEKRAAERTWSNGVSGKK